MGSFYIGLSLLSNHRAKAAPGTLRAEGRRILRELDRTAGPPGEAFQPPNGAVPAILTEPGGRPYFSGRHADFSISHSGMMSAAAYVCSGGGQNAGALRTGCDIQYADPEKSREETARDFFSSPEQDYIFSAPGKPERSLRFCHIWTLKESFLKARGLSIFDIQKAPVFTIGEGRDDWKAGVHSPGLARGHLHKSPFPMAFYLYELGRGPAYVLAVSLEGGGETVPPAPRFRWFSEDTLPLKSMAEIYAALSPEKTVRPNR